MLAVSQPLDKDLCQQVWRFVDEARLKFLEFQSGGGTIGTDYKVQALGRFENSGFPSFTTDYRSQTTDYEANFVAGSGRGGLEYEDWQSWKELVRHVEANQPLRDSFLVSAPGRDDERLRRDFFLIGIWLFAGGILDRVMRLHREKFSRDEFLGVYCEREAGALRTTLGYNVIVPVALTRFENTGSVDLADDCAVVELAEAMQLARMPEHPGPTSSANEIVVGAATHALVVRDLKMENCSAEPWPPYERPDWYPIGKIERFFAALRIVTGVDTGYAQLCLEPADGWAFGFERNLPPVIHGPFVRRYPLAFDDFGWLKARQPVQHKDLCRVADVMAALKRRPSLGLAGRRLSAAMLREEDDDRILDLLIGLEAVLGDGDKSEMTHKLALRTAAVLADARASDPTRIAADVKQLYAYRSAIAHGRDRSARKHRYLGEAGNQVAASTLGTLYLRKVVLRLAERPDLHDAKAIDAELILKRLATIEGSPEAGDD